MINKKTPVTIITGALNAGKTTFIRDLILANKTEKRVNKIAIIVNEFGALGIDSQMFSSEENDDDDITTTTTTTTNNNNNNNNKDSSSPSIHIKELSGGCMCCAVSVAFQVAVTEILRTVKPDWILIEPSGLGHPGGLYDQLMSEYLREYCDVRAIVCVCDVGIVFRAIMMKKKDENGCLTDFHETPNRRTFSDEDLMESETFRNQVSIADCVLGSKTNQFMSNESTKEEAIGCFREWADGLYPTKMMVKFIDELQSPWDALDVDVSRGENEMNMETARMTVKKKTTTKIDTSSNQTKPFQLPSVHNGKPQISSYDTDEYSSRGFLFHSTDLFSRAKVIEFFEHAHKTFPIVRAKAVIRVSNKTWVYPTINDYGDCCNNDNNSNSIKVSLEEIAHRRDSRFEFIVVVRNNNSSSNDDHGCKNNDKDDNNEEKDKADDGLWAELESRLIACRNV
jgi:G3E family GTPase